MEKVVYEIGNGKTISFIKPKESLKIKSYLDEEKNTSKSLNKINNKK